MIASLLVLSGSGKRRRSVRGVRWAFVRKKEVDRGFFSRQRIGETSASECDWILRGDRRRARSIQPTQLGRLPSRLTGQRTTKAFGRRTPVREAGPFQMSHCSVTDYSGSRSTNQHQHQHLPIAFHLPSLSLSHFIITSSRPRRSSTNMSSSGPSSSKPQDLANQPTASQPIDNDADDLDDLDGT